MLRTETVLGGFFLAAWLVALAYATELVHSPGLLRIDYYGLFTFAAAYGWVLGNFFVLRQRTLDPKVRRRFLGLYLAVPAGVVALARAMLPTELRVAAPLGGLLALAVYTVFWFVPLIVRRR